MNAIFPMKKAPGPEHGPERSLLTRLHLHIQPGYERRVENISLPFLFISMPGVSDRGCNSDPRTNAEIVDRLDVSRPCGDRRLGGHRQEQFRRRCWIGGGRKRRRKGARRRHRRQSKVLGLQTHQDLSRAPLRVRAGHADGGGEAPGCGSVLTCGWSTGERAMACDQRGNDGAIGIASARRSGRCGDGFAPITQDRCGRRARSCSCAGPADADVSVHREPAPRCGAGLAHVPTIRAAARTR